jgi:hypothetical protein
MKKLSLLTTLLWLIGVHISFAQQWSGSSTTTGLISRGGNVVIGGSSIVGSYSGGETVLQVRGANASVFGLRATSTSSMLDMYLGTTWLTLNAVNVPMSLATNYATRVKILTNGNVGIGTQLANNPNGYLLAVNGRVGAKEVQVENTSSTWADYVFEPEYKLRTLEEVETFIKQNKHLPEIPSAEDIKRDGHMLGEMDVLLLKKIEELTLYLIEQDKRMTMQSELIEEQKQLLHKLQKQLSQ